MDRGEDESESRNMRVYDWTEESWPRGGGVCEWGEGGGGRGGVSGECQVLIYRPSHDAIISPQQFREIAYIKIS